MRVGGAAHAHVFGSTCESASPPACHRVNAQGVRPTCESAGPRARRGTNAASTPRQTAPLKVSSYTWSSFAHTPGIWGYSYSHDETTTFNVDFPAPASQKVATKPTRLVHPSSWLPPTSIPIFPHQKAEKSPQNQHVLSFNPPQAPLVWRAPEGARGHGRSAVGRRRGLAGLRGDTPNRTSADQALPVWRTPEGPEGMAAVLWAAAGPVQASR